MLMVDMAPCPINNNGEVFSSYEHRATETASLWYLSHEELLRTKAANLCRWAVFSSRVDADDVYNETFLVLHRFLTKPDKWEGNPPQPAVTNLPAFLSVVMTNTYRTLKRNGDNRRTQPSEDIGVLYMKANHRQGLADQSINEKVDRMAIAEALARLTKKQRQALYRYEVEGLSYREIADLFGMRSLGSASRLLSQAREAFANAIDEQGWEGLEG